MGSSLLSSTVFDDALRHDCRDTAGDDKLIAALKTQLLDSHQGKIDISVENIEGDDNALRALVFQFKNGLPPSLRALVWMRLLGISDTNCYDEDFNAFMMDPLLNESNQRVIKSDVHRTRSSIAEYKNPVTRIEIEKLLTFYCKKEDFMYKQGMNEVIAPFFWLKSSSHGLNEIYRCFSAFVHKFLRNMYSDNNFGVLQCSFILFKHLLRYHDPFLCNYLGSHGVTPELYVTPWFLTIFSSKTPLIFLLSLWDYYIAENDPIFYFFVALALVLSKRGVLIATDVSQIPESISRLCITSYEMLEEIWHYAKLLRSQTPQSFGESLLRVEEEIYEIFTSPWDKSDSKAAYWITPQNPEDSTTILMEVEDEEAFYILPAELVRHAFERSKQTIRKMDDWKLFLLDLRPEVECASNGRFPLAYHVDVETDWQSPLNDVLSVINCGKGSSSYTHVEKIPHIEEVSEKEARETFQSLERKMEYPISHSPPPAQTLANSVSRLHEILPKSALPPTGNLSRTRLFHTAAEDSQPVLSHPLNASTESSASLTCDSSSQSKAIPKSITEFEKRSSCVEENRPCTPVLMSPSPPRDKTIYAIEKEPCLSTSQQVQPPDTSSHGSPASIPTNSVVPENTEAVPLPYDEQTSLPNCESEAPPGMQISSLSHSDGTGLPPSHRPSMAKNSANMHERSSEIAAVLEEHIVESSAGQSLQDSAECVVKDASAVRSTPSILKQSYRGTEGRDLVPLDPHFSSTTARNSRMNAFSKSNVHEGFCTEASSTIDIIAKSTEKAQPERKNDAGIVNRPIVTSPAYHICLVANEEDLSVALSVYNILTQDTLVRWVSIVKGGFDCCHNLAIEMSLEFVDHQNQNCTLCGKLNKRGSLIKQQSSREKTGRISLGNANSFNDSPKENTRRDTGSSFGGFMLALKKISNPLGTLLGNVETLATTPLVSTPSKVANLNDLNSSANLNTLPTAPPPSPPVEIPGDKYLSESCIDLVLGYFKWDAFWALETKQCLGLFEPFLRRLLQPCLRISHPTDSRIENNNKISLFTAAPVIEIPLTYLSASKQASLCYEPFASRENRILEGNDVSEAAKIAKLNVSEAFETVLDNKTGEECTRAFITNDPTLIRSRSFENITNDIFFSKSDSYQTLCEAADLFPISRNRNGVTKDREQRTVQMFFNRPDESLCQIIVTLQHIVVISMPMSVPSEAFSEDKTKSPSQYGYCLDFEEMLKNAGNRMTQNTSFAHVYPTPDFTNILLRTIRVGRLQSQRRVRHIQNSELLKKEIEIVKVYGIFPIDDVRKITSHKTKPTVVNFYFKQPEKQNATRNDPWIICVFQNETEAKQCAAFVKDVYIHNYRMGHMRLDQPT